MARDRQISVYVEDEIHDRIVEIAAILDMPVSRVVRFALADYIAKKSELAGPTPLVSHGER